MFQYYGSKKSLAKYYPAPKFDKIIEPFAGSAKYSLRYFEKDVILYDLSSDLVHVWHYLQSASEKDILSLPKLKQGDNLNDLGLLDIEKKFLGLLIVAAPFTTKNYTVSKLSEFAKGKNPYKEIAKNLFKIRHWKIINSCYSEIENQQVTWFIDPPYFQGGHKYPQSNKGIDFLKLADWCKSRNGQAIVCENQSADWLPFVPLKSNSGANNIPSTEVIWTNLPTSYAFLQTNLF